jgi:hypothetical protein
MDDVKKREFSNTRTRAPTPRSSRPLSVGDNVQLYYDAVCCIQVAQ